MSPVQDDAAHWDHLEGLMEAALALPAEDRERFLDAAGGVAGALRDELLSLISCAARAESFFNGLAGVVDAAADSLGGELTSADSPPDDSFSANTEVDPLLGQTVGSVPDRGTPRRRGHGRRLPCLRHACSARSR